MLLQVFACTTLSESERDICEAVLRMGGFHLGADLVPSKGHRNVLVVATEDDSSINTGFRVTRPTSKLWNCLAMGGMVISHTWLFASAAHHPPHISLRVHLVTVLLQVHECRLSHQPRAVHRI
jgi:hypothetical protein